MATFAVPPEPIEAAYIAVAHRILDSFRHGEKVDRSLLRRLFEARDRRFGRIRWLVDAPGL